MDEKQKLTELMEKLTRNTIDTPIDVIKERIAKTPRADVVKELNATYTQLMRLQYNLREYAIVEWFNTLDSRRQELHYLFEKNREFFKCKANGSNWLYLSDVECGGIDTEIFEEARHFAFFKDSDDMKVSMDKLKSRECLKCLCVPIFKAI